MPRWFAVLLAGLRSRWDALELALARKFGVASAEDRTFLLLVGATGVVAGLLGVLVHRLIYAVELLLWGPKGHLMDASASLPAWRVVFALGLGGVLVGCLALVARRAVAGPGMSILIEAVALKGGRVPVRPLLWSAAAAVATVGAGGSVGREGPMIRLGAMIASRWGLRYGLSPHRVKILVGCGAAGGLAAAYNIPIGGALFAMEVILGSFALPVLGPVIVASVLSTLISRAFEGDTHRFFAPGLGTTSGWEWPFFVLLGVLGALASIGFVFGVRRMGEWLQRIPCPEPLRPVLGFTALGAVSLAVPWVLGGGQETTNLLLLGWLPREVAAGQGVWTTAGALLLLAAAKIAATGWTTGTGGAGGLFAPSMFVGALVGAAFGMGVQALFPSVASPYGAYAVIGMAAMAAGTSHAPISAILILFEFTGNYGLILPLMVAAITSSSLSRRLYPWSIYTEPLRQKGVDLSRPLDASLLQGLRVSDLAREDPDTLSPAHSYRQVMDRFLATPRSRLFVVDAAGRLTGAVSLHDIKHALDRPDQLQALFARDLAVPCNPVLAAEDPLQRAVEHFAGFPAERLPVVGDEGRFEGVLAKRDLLAVFAQEAVGRPALLANYVSSDGERTGRRLVELPPDFAVQVLEVPPALDGKTLAEARLPQRFGVRVLELQRAAPGVEPARSVPDAGTLLYTRDRLLLLGATTALATLAAAWPERSLFETP